ncbi:unnamed protein product, partial [Rotaria sordida]
TGHCCGDPCTTENDCDGSLICVSGKCGTGSSGGGTTAPTTTGSSGTCSPSGVLQGTG